MCAAAAKEEAVARRPRGPHPARKRHRRALAKRLSNREIAEQLFFSEGSVKQYINQIYSKLLITGNVRTKRKRLAELAAPKS